MRNFYFLFIYSFCLVACTSEQKETVQKTHGPSQPAVYKAEKNTEIEPLTTSEKSKEPNQFIIPGKRIGLINLNEDVEVVRQILGKPTTVDAAMGKSLQTWISKTADGKTQQISIFFSRNMGNADEKSRAKQIRITEAAFKTKANYASTETLLRSNISETKKTVTYTLPGSKNEFTIFDNIKTGIAFEFDPPGNVIAITVHEPDKAAFEVFTDISPDLKKMKPSEQTTFPMGPGAIKD